MTVIKASPKGFSDVFTPMHQTALAKEACPHCSAKRLNYNRGWFNESPHGIPPAKSINVAFECGGYYKDVQPSGAKTPPIWETSLTCQLRIDNERYALAAEARQSQEDFSRLRPMADAAERTAQVLRVPVNELVPAIEQLVARHAELEAELEEELAKQASKSADS